MPKVVPEYKAQARARIVEAARVVFQRKGFRSATMEDIAEELGVSKGALYLYFRTKAQLLVQIQARTRADILQKWEGLLEEGDIAEGIAHSLDGIFSGEVDPAIWHELVAEAAGDPEVRRALELDRRADTKLMRQFLVKLQTRGRIPPMKDPSGVTQVILILLQGTALQIMFEGREGDSRRTLVRGIRLALGL
jgi:AcrR family transcriptional regulator